MTDPYRSAWQGLLGDDPITAEQEYRILRMKLLRFFQWNRCRSPEDMAQEAICRALRRISEGQVIRSDNPHSYFFGFAKNLLHEDRKRSATDPVPLPEQFEVAAEETKTLKLNPVQLQILFLERLTELSADDKQFIISYYSEDTRKLAVELGATENAIRIRAHRIVRRLEDPSVTASRNKLK